MDFSGMNERTFQYDDDLPPLPVPPLQQTLDKYTESVKPFLSDDELQETKEIVEKFGNGVGEILQAELVKRSKEKKNWLEQWWMEKAYMESRIPMGVLQNFSGPFPAQNSYWPPREGTQLERGAIILWHILGFYQFLRQEMLPVEKNKAGTRTFSMDQFRTIFNACREPGPEKDTFFSYFKTEREGPCPNHIHVMCNGHIFKMVPFDKDGERLSVAEIHRQFSYIKEMSRERGQCIGALTADDRVTYAKAFDHLVSLAPANRAHIETIKSSIVGYIIDEGHPQSDKETFLHGIAGPPVHDRWFDKAYSTAITTNGVAHNNVDHAACDGMTVIILSLVIHRQLLKDGGRWPEENTIRPDITMPSELIFTIDKEIEDGIIHATQVYRGLAANFDFTCSSYSLYGKDFLKKHNMHPDTTIQLAIQLAYFTMYRRPGATYETATTRQYYHGRTETVRSCTAEATEWCKAMLDPGCQSSNQLSLLRTAYEKHNTLMAEASNGRGIDRHLLGLYVISQEMGLPIPEIFLDKAFTLSGGGGNFPLSTSTVGYTPMQGAIAPMRNDGYMICYRIGSKEFQFSVSAFKNCADTDSYTFFLQLTLALNQIGRLLRSSNL